MPPRVAFFCPLWAKQGPFRLGWSDYWRLYLPAVALQRHGWEVVLGRAVLPDGTGRLSVKDAEGAWWGDRDVLVFSRWMHRLAPELIRNAREAGQVLVNDLDDLFWGLPLDHPVTLCTDPERDLEYNRRHYFKTFPESSLITVSTPYLAGVAGGWGPRVEIVRNAIDLSVWEVKAPGRYVGWVGSTAGRSTDLEILREAVVPWLRSRGETFYHGGRQPEDPRMADVLDYASVLERRAQPIDSYPLLWDPLRVALCPLGSEAFSRAKSWVKPLEAAARGIPFVASDHVEYRSLGFGRIAKTPGDWVRHLEELEDPETYARECAENRRGAERLALEHNWTRWERVLTKEEILAVS